MAYMNAKMAAVIRNDLKEKFPQFKFSIRVSHHTGLDVAIMSGPVRFHAADHCGINQYHLHQYENSDILSEMIQIINKKNWNRSDIQTDYFDVGFYLHLSQGKWNKPYVVKK